MNLIKFLMATLVVFFTMFLLNSTASAQTATPICGDRMLMIERLNLTYGEQQLGVGVVDSNSIFELWASEATGTWTILKTYTNGVSCVMLVGENWVTNSPASDPT